MKTHRKRRRHLTLIEIMIVIVLIGLISGVIAYNMRGSLHEGKMFKTEQGGAQVYNILMLEAARGRSLTDLAAGWQDAVRRSQLAKDPNQLLVDAWGHQYDVQATNDDLFIESSTYTQHYNQKNGTSGPHYLR